MISQEYVDNFHGWFNALLNNVAGVIRGKRQEIAMTLVAVLSEGHVLLEDHPGTGKTSLAKAIANSIRGSWSRIQFTPDLLPSDVTGGLVLNQRTGEFEFRPGPVFSNVLLADEINRASPKTQSALLQAMEESQVTIDRATHDLPRPFIVIATQNPDEVGTGGTYDLPQAQIDRFMMRLSLGYPGHDAEVDVLTDVADGVGPASLEAVLDTNDVLGLIRIAAGVYVSPQIQSYIVRLADATRTKPDVIQLGVSTRGCVAMMRASRSLAASQARNFVTADDVKTIAHAVMGHRLLLTPRAELDGIKTDAIIEDVLLSVDAPDSVPTRI